MTPLEKEMEGGRKRKKKKKKKEKHTRCYDRFAARVAVKGASGEISLSVQRLTASCCLISSKSHLNWFLFEKQIQLAASP